MTDRDLLDDASLERLLDLVPPPPMPSGLAARIVTEARRPGRAQLRTYRRRRVRSARRSVWLSVLALNLVLASAVAAAFGGGVLSMAKIAVAAHDIAYHLGHSLPLTAPRRSAANTMPITVRRPPAVPVRRGSVTGADVPPPTKTAPSGDVGPLRNRSIAQTTHTGRPAIGRPIDRKRPKSRTPHRAERLRRRAAHLPINARRAIDGDRSGRDGVRDAVLPALTDIPTVSPRLSDRAGEFPAKGYTAGEGWRSTGRQPYDEATSDGGWHRRHGGVDVHPGGTPSRGFGWKRSGRRRGR